MMWMRRLLTWGQAVLSNLTWRDALLIAVIGAAAYGVYYTWGLHKSNQELSQSLQLEQQRVAALQDSTRIISTYQDSLGQARQVIARLMLPDVPQDDSEGTTVAAIDFEIDFGEEKIEGTAARDEKGIYRLSAQTPLTRLSMQLIQGAEDTLSYRGTLTYRPQPLRLRAQFLPHERGKGLQAVIDGPGIIRNVSAAGRPVLPPETEKVRPPRLHHQLIGGVGYVLDERHAYAGVRSRFRLFGGIHLEAEVGYFNGPYGRTGAAISF